MAFRAFECLEIPSRRTFLRALLVGGSVTLPFGFSALAAAADAKKKLPAWSVIDETVRRTLATKRGYQPGDLLSRGDVQNVLDQVGRVGWDVANRADLLKNTLEDGSFLVRQLQSAPGIRFSRAALTDPNVYDRLDRLSRFSGGENLIATITTMPGGSKLMAKPPSPNFGDLTALLPKQANGLTPRDKDFNKPTGKIYTEKQLLTALAESYKKATA